MCLIGFVPVLVACWAEGTVTVVCYSSRSEKINIKDYLHFIS